MTRYRGRHRRPSLSRRATVRGGQLAAAACHVAGTLAVLTGALAVAGVAFLATRVRHGTEPPLSNDDASTAEFWAVLGETVRYADVEGAPPWRTDTMPGGDQ